ncbi:MAG: ferredoxin [Micromonosporaceae bacterium]|nr:ferredoxin [Micromonosporaceae bacterium]
MSGAVTSWRITVDGDRCMGSGVCAGVAPGHFRVDAGTARPLAELIEPDDAACDAAESCPTEAITVRDAATGDLVAPETN